jgi:hypothetical protein
VKIKAFEETGEGLPLEKSTRNQEPAHKDQLPQQPKIPKDTPSRVRRREGDSTGQGEAPNW